MDIDELKTFVEVYRTRHFGQAAENLYVSQSTVSARIRQLEQSLGVSLFTRDRNNIQLTQAGAKLLTYAESILTSWTRARFEISLEEEGQVPFIIGGVPSLWDVLLQDVISHIHKSLPDTAIYAETETTEILFKRVAEQTMDLAFTFEPLQSSDVDVIEITHVPLVMVSTYQGLKVNEVFTNTYVFVDWGTSFATSHARHFRDVPPPGIRIALGRVAKDFILSQEGTAYLPDPMVQRDIESGRLHYVKDAPVIDRMAYALFSPRTNKQDLITQTLSIFNPTLSYIKKQTVET